METLEKNYFNSQEKKESNFESKEKELDEELKAAAKMERADFLSKEIKSGNKQIKNIMMHMNQVLKAIKDLRDKLQLPTNNSNGDSSVLQDKKQIEKIKDKIKNHKQEILKMKDDLIKIQFDILKKENKNSSDEILKKQAEKNVLEILKILED